MTDTQRIKSSAVKTTTGLNRVKMVADTLLTMKVGKTDMSPIVFSHPFTSSGIVGVRGDQGMEVLDNFRKDDIEIFHEEGAWKPGDICVVIRSKKKG